MRAKHILNRLPLASKVKIVYERVTLTRFTTAFVFLALAHCLVQITLQSLAYVSNTRGSNEVSTIIENSGMPHLFSFVKSGTLFVCNGVPDGEGFNSTCWAFAGPGSHGNDDDDDDKDDDDKDDDKKEKDKDEADDKEISEGKDKHSNHKRGLTVVPVEDDSGTVVAVNVTGADSNHANPDGVIQLSSHCVSALNWPDIILHDARREDLSFLIYQIWLFGVSVVAVLNESIPHLIAALITNVLSTAWSAFQLSRTGQFQFDYETLVVNDACDGNDVIEGFWTERMRYFTPILVLNIVAFFGLFFVALKLFSVYARQTKKRVGTSKVMRNRYICVLLFSVFLQISAFFTICASALWIDALCNGVLQGKTAYRVVFTITAVIELPWVICGWLSIRREHRIWSLVFLVVGLFITASWTTMFANVLYRWTFENFPFFATLSISAFIVLVIVMILAVICRLNFGKGLPQFYKTEDTFDDSKFIPVTIPQRRSRASRLFSVVFPDRRVSQRNSSEKPGERPTSVIDIKGSSGFVHISDSASEISMESNDSIVSKGEMNTANNLERNPPSNESLISRARVPFLRISGGSRLGKLSLRFSAFTTTSSVGSDLERGERNVPEVPMIPKSSTASAPGRTRSNAVFETPKTPSPPPKVLRKSSVHSVKAPATLPPPDINVIPASLTDSFMQNSVRSGRGVLSSVPYSDDMEMSSRYDVSSTRSIRTAPRRSGTMPSGRIGLPGNPRVLRSAEHGERSKIVVGTP